MLAYAVFKTAEAIASVAAIALVIGGVLAMDPPYITISTADTLRVWGLGAITISGLAMTLTGSRDWYPTWLCNLFNPLT